MKGVEKELTRLLTEATQSLETLTEYWQNSCSLEQIEQALNDVEKYHEKYYRKTYLNNFPKRVLKALTNLKQQKEGK